MKVKIFLGGLHKLDQLEDDVETFTEREGISPEDIVDFKAVSPDTGEISLILLYLDR